MVAQIFAISPGIQYCFWVTTFLGEAVLVASFGFSYYRRLHSTSQRSHVEILPVIDCQFQLNILHYIIHYRTGEVITG